MSLIIYGLSIIISDTLVFLLIGAIIGVLIYGIVLLILKDDMFIEMTNLIMKKFKR